MYNLISFMYFFIKEDKSWDSITGVILGKDESQFRGKYI